ncbi:MAG TPA: hypothetical protein VIW67_05785 [Terriglobales bacterium]|jgi:hypothetical protein
MQLAKTFKGLVLGSALLLATSAFAASKGPLQLTSPANVAGKQLPAGDYTVKWDGNGPSVQLEIIKGKNVVATVPAQVVTLDHASNYDSAVVNTDNSGGRVLSQIRFSGKKMALSVGGEGGASSGGSSSN